MCSLRPARRFAYPASHGLFASSAVPAPTPFGATRSPPSRRVTRPSVLLGVWHSPSAPLTQILGKGRPDPHAGVPRGAGGPHCPFYPPCVTPGMFSITGVSGSGPCRRGTSTEDKLSPAPGLAPSQPQSPPPCPPHSSPRPGTSPAARRPPKTPIRPHAGVGTVGPRFGRAPAVTPGAGAGFCFAFDRPISLSLARPVNPKLVTMPGTGSRVQVTHNRHPEPRHPHRCPAEPWRHELALSGLDSSTPGLAPLPWGTPTAWAPPRSTGTQKEETSSPPPSL